MAGDAAHSMPSLNGKRETLTARAERIIGRSLHTHPLADATPRGATHEPQTRRREQILQAQRTHRRRTQDYIRELENTVLRLRDKESGILERLRRMQGQVRILKEALDTHDIAIPRDADFHLADDVPGSPNFNSTRDEGSYMQPIRIDLTELGAISPARVCSVQAAEDPRPIYMEPPSLTGNLYAARPDGGIPTAARAVNSPPMAELDTQAAIDFVLTLEKPCLPHVKCAYLSQTCESSRGDVPYNSGPSHIFTATAALVHQHRHQHPATSSFTVPTDDIDKLLDASRSLELDNEITPVQIWASIRDSSAPNLISIRTLRALTDELGKYVRCNSFGAVMEKSTATAILSRFF